MEIRISFNSLSAMSVEDFQKTIQSNASETEIKQSAFIALRQHQPEALKAGLSPELVKKVDEYAQERQKEITKCARELTKLGFTKEEFYEYQWQFKARRVALEEAKESYKNLTNDSDNPLELKEIQAMDMDKKVSKKLSQIPDERVCVLLDPTSDFWNTVRNLEDAIIFLRKFPREESVKFFGKTVQQSLKAGITVEDMKRFIKEKQYQMADEILSLLDELSLGMDTTSKASSKQHDMNSFEIHFKALNANLSYYKSYHEKREEFIQQLQNCLESGVEEEQIKKLIQKKTKIFIDTPEEIVKKHEQEDAEAKETILELFHQELPKIKEKLPEILRQQKEAYAKAKAEREARIAENRPKLIEKLSDFLLNDEEMRKHPEYKKFIQQKQEIRELFKRVITFCSLDEMLKHKALSEDVKSRVSYYYQSLACSLKEEKEK